MYSSLNSYPNQTFFSTSRPFSFESNPSSKDIETNYCSPLPPPLLPPPPLSFFQFPFSPFEDNNNNNHNEIFNHLEQPQQQQQPDLLLHQSLPPEAVMNIDAAASAMMNSKIPGKAAAATTGQGTTAMMEQIPRKRSIKRDRHSKINTARGLRDRRMRLSLEVAKRFFGLQDMLGFDKASKTVEWLLNQAKVEIKQLARDKNQNQNSCSSVGGAKSASSTSECEGVSSLDEVVVSEINHQEQQHTTIGKRRIKACRRKSAFNPIGREKARERARERTREKMMKTKRLIVADHDESNYWNINPFEKEQSVNHPSLDLLQPEADQEPSYSQAKEHSRTVVEEDMAHEDSFLIMNKWSPTTMMFTSLNNSGSILQEPHQFAEFQSLRKHWEAYNNRI